MFRASLTKFAEQNRYVYLNQISEERISKEKENKPKWLSSHWNELTDTIIPLRKASEYLEDDRLLREYKEIIADSLVICVERLLGALYRSITLGNMNSDANSAGILLYDFAKLNNTELGKTKYNILGYSPV